jgi:hypothetical protein
MKKIILLAAIFAAVPQGAFAQADALEAAPRVIGVELTVGTLAKSREKPARDIDDSDEAYAIGARLVSEGHPGKAIAYYRRADEIISDALGKAEADEDAEWEKERQEKAKEEQVREEKESARRSSNSDRGHSGAVHDIDRGDRGDRGGGRVSGDARQGGPIEIHN